MSQNDLVIANQSFPSFRTDLNSALQAINTSQSGTSRPSGAVAGTIWLDTTSATSPTLKYYDGADDISLATLDHTANTVNWLDSTVSITGLTTTATGTVLTLSDSSLTSSVNLILQNQKEIRFSETTANGTNYVGFKAPASLSADKIWILPSADGTAGQFLKTDGAGNLSFDSLSFATPLAVIGNATAGSEIRLPEDTDNGSNYVAIKAPDTIASNLTLTLPSADGTSGQVLQTNGSGVLSFSSPSSDFVKLATTTISSSTATITLDGYMSSTYKHYKFVVSDLEPVGASYYYLYIRYLIANTEATASNYTSSCGGGYVDTNGTTGSYNFGQYGANKFWIGTNIGNNDGYGFNMEFTILEAQATDRYKAFVGVNTQRNQDFSSYFTHSIGGIYYGSQSALTGISFSGTANFDKGTITMYGIK